MRRRRLLFIVTVLGVMLASGTAGAEPAPTWVQQSPVTSPPARTYSASAYDAARGEVVLFGGMDFTGPYVEHYFSDTWVWDGKTWSERHPLVSPPARAGHTIAYDPVRLRVVLFGGAVFGRVLNDTWEWDGTNWTPRIPLMSPSSRDDAVMAYDSASKSVVLFGGYDGSRTLGDTWEWNGKKWMLQPTPIAPAPRALSAMTEDPNGRLVLFSGYSISPGSPGIGNDTWEWDGSRWRQLQPPVSPGMEFDHAIAYDADRRRVVMLGPWSNGQVQGETWEFDGQTWMQVATSSSPLRWNASMSYDQVRHQVVLFGGSTNECCPARSAETADTWVYGQPSPPGPMPCALGPVADVLRPVVPQAANMVCPH